MNRLHIVTLVLDGMPFLPIQFSNYNRLSSYDVDWHWHIVHGAAANTGSTKWCRAQYPRLSRDGTTELLATWKGHPRISIYELSFWHGGKDQMFRRALADIKEPCVLLQADADEFWSADKLVTLVRLIGCYQSCNCARFFARFFLGPNIVTVGENSYGNQAWDWYRAWRYSGQHLVSHEPPKIEGLDKCISRDVTRHYDLIFDHWAYMFESQVHYKESFYGYKDAVKNWRRLQANTVWPTKLKPFLPWVDENAVADLLHKP